MNFGIIAAGEGSRLVQEGVALPKPLVQLCGSPMIGRLIDIFLSNGAGEIDVIVNGHMTEVARFLELARPEVMARGCFLNVVVKSTPSSMHSFFELSRLLRGKGRFVVTTVDTVFRPDDFAGYVDAFRDAPDSVDGMMAVTSYIDDEKPLYVATAPDMRVMAFSDTPVADARFISGGIYGLSDKALDVLGLCMEKGVSRMRNYQRALLENGLSLRAYDMNKIIDVDHAADIATAEAFLGCPRRP